MCFNHALKIFRFGHIKILGTLLQINCFNYVRRCPENAIKPAISRIQVEEHIRERV
jgi:hypothetical protein